MDEWYSVPKLASELGYSRERLYQLIKAGLIKAHKADNMGGYWVIHSMIALPLITSRKNGVGKYHMFDRIKHKKKKTTDSSNLD